MSAAKSVALIVAMAKNRVIGKDNQLPWKLSADLKRFKALTMGHTLVMGRKTFESIGRPLPGRTTVVISRRADYAPDGVLVAHSLDEAIAKAPSQQVFIAGGGEIFTLAAARATRLYLTLIDEDYAGDAYFPALDLSAWRIEHRERHEPSDAFAYAYEFIDYVR